VAALGLIGLDVTGDEEGDGAFVESAESSLSDSSFDSSFDPESQFPLLWKDPIKLPRVLGGSGYNLLAYYRYRTQVFKGLYIQSPVQILVEVCL
jgi:hypothetical protein